MLASSAFRVESLAVFVAILFRQRAIFFSISTVSIEIWSCDRLTEEALDSFFVGRELLEAFLAVSGAVVPESIVVVAQSFKVSVGKVNTLCPRKEIH